MRGDLVFVSLEEVEIAFAKMKGAMDELIPTIRRVGEVTMTATISHRGMLELIRLGIVEAPRPRRGQQSRHRRKHPVLRRRRAGHIAVSDRRRAG